MEEYRTTGGESTGGFPFPFTDAILEQFKETENSPPIWERLVPDWTPESGIPLHLAGMKENLYAGRVFLWQIISQRIPELEDPAARFAMEACTSILSKMLDFMEEFLKLGLMTCHIDPVVVNAVKGNGNGVAQPLLDVKEYEEGIESVKAKLRHRMSFRVVREMRETFPVAEGASAYPEITDFLWVNAPLTASQFPVSVLGLAYWLDEYEALPWAFKAFVKEWGKSPEKAKWYGETLSEAFRRLQSLFAMGVAGKDRFVDFAHLAEDSRTPVTTNSAATA